MTEKRYYAHKHLLQENKVHDKICHNFMNIDETVEHMNNQYWKYKQLKEENDKLKSENKRLTNKLNETALEFLNYNMVTMGKATEISEMCYSDFLKFRKENGNPMELQE